MTTHTSIVFIIPFHIFFIFRPLYLYLQLIQELVGISTTSFCPEIVLKVAKVWLDVLDVDDVRAYILQLPAAIIVPFAKHMLTVSLLSKNDQLRLGHLEDMIDELTLQGYTDPHIREVTSDALLLDNNNRNSSSTSTNGKDTGSNIRDRSKDARVAEEVGCTGSALVGAIAPLLSSLGENVDVAQDMNASIAQEYQSLLGYVHCTMTYFLLCAARLGSAHGGWDARTNLI